MTPWLAEATNLVNLLTTDPFRPHRFLKGPHLQTVVGTLVQRRSVPTKTVIERVELEDGDQTTIHLNEPENATDDSPILLILHGLEGSADRPYMNRTARKALVEGFRTARMNMRLCGDAENVSKRFYNGAQSEDVSSVCSWLSDRFSRAPVTLMGFSLGGNLVLKAAGQSGCANLKGAVAVCPPVEPQRAVVELLKGFNRVYHYRFVCGMVSRARRYLERFPQPFIPPLSKTMTIREFDRLFTAPMGGYKSLEDYYEACSPKRWLKKMGCPSLIITAKDDPIVPFISFSDIMDLVPLLVPGNGGHLGFVGAPRNGDPDRFWAENRAIDFLKGALTSPANPVPATALSA